MLTWHQQYDGGRTVARLGQIDVGAVFPGSPVRWRCWLWHTCPREGKSRSVLAAKNALLGEIMTWLQCAGLSVATGGEGDG